MAMTREKEGEMENWKFESGECNNDEKPRLEVPGNEGERVVRVFEARADNIRERKERKIY